MLELIATAQKAGFSLDEIRTLLPPDLAQWKHGALIEALRHKVKDIEAMQMWLKQIATGCSHQGYRGEALRCRLRNQRTVGAVQHSRKADRATDHGRRQREIFRQDQSTVILNLH